MNAGKTQLLLSANAGSYQLGEPDAQPGNGPCRPGNGGGRPGNGGGRPGNGGGQLGKGSGRLGKGEDHPNSVSVIVDEKVVRAEDTNELLGVSYDRRLTTKPHAKAMLVAVKQRAVVIARLVNHIPRGKYLWQLATGLVNRKLGHALAAYATPRLPAPSGEAENPTTINHQIQVAYNRVARSITGVKIRDRVSVPNLLERAGMPSINGMVVNAVTMEIWNCRHSSDGGNRAKNFVGSLIFNTSEAVKTTRAASAGMAVVPLRGRDTFVANGARTWKALEALMGGNVKVVREVRHQKSCSKISALVWVLRDVNPRLRPVGCSLRVVGRLLRDVGGIPGDVNRVRREAWHIFCTVSNSLLPSFFSLLCCYYEE
jgi:hypothetical protein